MLGWLERPAKGGKVSGSIPLRFTLNSAFLVEGAIFFLCGEL